MKLTSALLRKATRVAADSAAVQRQLTEAFQERYGVTYSDVDADPIIDALDYGTGRLSSLAECDRIMAEHGAPRLTLKEPRP